ncbi:MAG: hypothetical protein H8D23_14850 [Candidatus Brocadiales bacterium]|nr:hypothetical protein [Candidatus Brocadiales bacterium]
MKDSFKTSSGTGCLIVDVFKYQVLSYLKVSNLEVGLLVNFGHKSCLVKRLIYKFV